MEGCIGQNRNTIEYDDPDFVPVRAMQGKPVVYILVAIGRPAAGVCISRVFPSTPTTPTVFVAWVIFTWNRSHFWYLFFPFTYNLSSIYSFLGIILCK